VLPRGRPATAGPAPAVVLETRALNGAGAAALRQYRAMSGTADLTLIDQPMESAMANVSNLIGVLLQGNLAPSGQQRIGSALEQLQRAGLGALAGSGSGNGSGAVVATGAGAPAVGGTAALLSGLLGALQGGAAPANPAAPGQSPTTQSGPASASAAALLGGLLGALQGPQQGAGGSPVGTAGRQSGGVLAALAGAVLGGQRSGGGGAAGGGAMALLAMLAMQALQGATRAGMTAPAVTSGFGANIGAAGPWSGGEVPVALHGPRDEVETEALALTSELVLKGMINAAKADGMVSPAELQRIVGKLGEAGSEPAIQQWVQQQLAAPLDVQAFAAEIPCQEVAAQVYAASLLAIEVDTDAERQYLQALAQATDLHPLVVEQLHQSLGVQP